MPLPTLQIHPRARSDSLSQPGAQPRPLEVTTSSPGIQFKLKKKLKILVKATALRGSWDLPKKTPSEDRAGKSSTRDRNLSTGQGWMDKKIIPRSGMDGNYPQVLGGKFIPRLWMDGNLSTRCGWIEKLSPGQREMEIYPQIGDG